MDLRFKIILAGLKTVASKIIVWICCSIALRICNIFKSSIGGNWKHSLRNKLMERKTHMIKKWNSLEKIWKKNKF